MKRARDSVRNMRFSRVFLIFVIECLLLVVSAKSASGVLKKDILSGLRGTVWCLVFVSEKLKLLQGEFCLIGIWAYVQIIEAEVF